MKPKGQLQILHRSLLFWRLHTVQGKQVAPFSCPPQHQKHVVHTYRNLFISSPFPYVLLPSITLTWFLPSFIHLWARYHINLYRKLMEFIILHWRSISVPKHSFISLYSFLFSLHPPSLIFFNQSFTLSYPSGQVNTSCCLYWCKQRPQLKLHARCYTEKWCFILESQLF